MTEELKPCPLHGTKYVSECQFCFYHACRNAAPGSVYYEEYASTPYTSAKVDGKAHGWPKTPKDCYALITKPAMDWWWLEHKLATKRSVIRRLEQQVKALQAPRSDTIVTHHIPLSEDEAVEIMARALCLSNGCEPDELNPGNIIIHPSDNLEKWEDVNGVFLDTLSDDGTRKPDGFDRKGQKCYFMWRQFIGDAQDVYRALLPHLMGNYTQQNNPAGLGSKPDNPVPLVRKMADDDAKIAPRNDVGVPSGHTGEGVEHWKCGCIKNIHCKIHATHLPGKGVGIQGARGPWRAKLDDTAFQKAWEQWLNSNDVAKMDKYSSLKGAISVYLAHLPTEPVKRDTTYNYAMIEKHADHACMFQSDAEVIETRWVKLMDSPPEPVKDNYPVTPEGSPIFGEGSSWCIKSYLAGACTNDVKVDEYESMRRMLARTTPRTMRHAQMLEWSEGEKAINRALHAVESMGYSEALTDAVIVLSAAQHRVADHCIATLNDSDTKPTETKEMNDARN